MTNASIELCHMSLWVTLGAVAVERETMAEVTLEHTKQRDKNGCNENQLADTGRQPADMWFHTAPKSVIYCFSRADMPADIPEEVHV